MSHKIFNELIQYERARLKFCQSIADAASRPQYISYMENEGIIDLVQPLLSDPELAVRSNAVCCFGRMANHSPKVAQELIDRQIPQIVLKELSLERNNNVHYHRAVMQVFKAIAKYSPEMAGYIVNCGGLSALLICLESSDVLLRETSCCGIGCIVRQSAEFASAAINQGAIPLLLFNLQQNELNLKLVAALVLCDMVRHTSEHADTFCKSDGIIHMSAALDNINVKLKKHALTALANVASHKADLALSIVQWNILTKVLIHLGHESPLIQKHAARLIQELVKHSIELAQVAVNDGAIGALIQLLFSGSNNKEDTVTPAATALGYIAGQSPHFALAIVECKGVQALTLLLDLNRANCQLASCIWALGHIGKHSSEHCKALAEENTFAKIMEIMDSSASDDDLRQKCKNTFKSCIQCCLHMPALEMLLYNANEDILDDILAQFAKVLPNNDVARRLFLTTGPLRKVLSIEAEPDSNTAKLIEAIKACYSNEVIKMYSPRNIETAMNKINQFKPQDFFINNCGDDVISTDRSESIKSLKT